MEEIKTGVTPVEAVQENITKPETTQPEIDAAISKRLAAQEKKIRAEYEAKYKPQEQALNAAMSYFELKTPDELVQTIKRAEYEKIAEAMKDEPTKAVEMMEKMFTPQTVAPVVEEPEAEEPEVPEAQKHVNAAFERAIALGIEPKEVAEMATASPEFKSFVESGMSFDEAAEKAGFVKAEPPAPLKRAANAAPKKDLSQMSSKEFMEYHASLERQARGY
jgi:hypothetical protein